MKPEPLKDKQRPFQLYMEQTIAFTADDIKSAVEWLKNRVKKMKLNIIIPEIDKAFEDVIKK